MLEQHKVDDVFQQTQYFIYVFNTRGGNNSLEKYLYICLYMCGLGIHPRSDSRGLYVAL